MDMESQGCFTSGLDVRARREKKDFWHEDTTIVSQREHSASTEDGSRDKAPDIAVRSDSDVENGLDGEAGSEKLA
jgi:hypothetical protein